MHCPATQSFPLPDDRPDALSQCNDTISRGKYAALSGLGDPVRQPAFAPVFSVDIFFRHQAAQVKDHFDPETTLQSESNRRGNMTTRMNHLDPITTNERAGFAIACHDVVD